MKTTKRDYWKPKEVAELYRVSVSAVMKWIHSRQLGSLKLPSKRYLIPAEEVERIKNTAWVPEARLEAEEFKRREKDRELRQKAADARLRQFTIRKKEQTK